MRYTLIPLRNPDMPSAAKEYFTTLIEKDVLKHRLPDVKNPNLVDVGGMVGNPLNMCFAIIDMEEKVMAGEVMLNNFQGASAMIHFSIRPSYWGKTLQLSREVLIQVFGFENIDTGFKLVSLIGLTPVTNKLAVKHLQKVGFEVKTVLSGSFIMKNEDNAIVDGVLSELKSQETRGWVEREEINHRD